MADSQGRASFRQSLNDALATPELRRVQLGWTAASVGGWGFFIVLAVYAYSEGGVAAVGVAALGRVVPAGLGAPLAGVIVDRRSRRDVLVAITVGRALVLAGIAAAVAADAPLAVVLALGAGFTALATAHKPAQAALLPALAETPRQIAASNAVLTAVDSAGFLAGSLLGGGLVAAASIETAFLVTTGVFAVAAWPLARVACDPDPAPSRAGGRGRTGVRGAGVRLPGSDSRPEPPPARRPLRLFDLRGRGRGRARCARRDRVARSGQRRRGMAEQRVGRWRHRPRGGGDLAARSRPPGGRPRWRVSPRWHPAAARGGAA